MENGRALKQCAVCTERSFELSSQQLVEEIKHPETKQEEYNFI